MEEKFLRIVLAPTSILMALPLCLKPSFRSSFFDRCILCLIKIDIAQSFAGHFPPHMQFNGKRKSPGLWVALRQMQVTFLRVVPVLGRG